MRLSFLLVSFFIPYVLGNKLAGPWQMIFLWYAYQLDIRAGNGSPTRIAVGCHGSNNGLCYFDELLQYAQYSNQKWNGNSGVGQNLKPDVVSTADKLTKGGYVSNWDNEHLFGVGSGITQTFAAQWSHLVNQIQDIRTTIKAHPPFIDLSDLLDPLKLSLQGVHEQRIIDNAQELTKVLAAYLGYTPETKTRKALDGQTIEELDQPATEAKHPGFTAKFAGLWAWVSQTKLKNKPLFKSLKLGLFTSHQNVVHEVQRIETLLHTPCP